MTSPRWPAAETIDCARLVLEPLRREHAGDLFRVLDDERLRGFIGGRPATEAELAARVTRQIRGTSSDGAQGWCNWVVRHRQTGSVIGTVQATLRTEAPERVAAEVAWVIATPQQSHGFASEAATGMARWLLANGANVLIAHVHPDHQASGRVARRIGLTPTAVVVDGETRWSTEPED
ncbi:GNAT family N-acetyltransferase [Pengzhenrongella phosphoraccumulans]|uniref:GNAT family N-acetyltransferase n=1 Tax=Pengzhenrongella phosphoraccumulans TaxID=3114394 RepID=UPI00388E43FB